MLCFYLQSSSSSISVLPSKDFKIYTSKQSKACWLLGNKHQCTTQVWASLTTFPNRYPVLLHTIPSQFEPNNQSHLEALGTQNRIDPALIQSARWLNNPTANGKKNGTIVLQLLDKNIALKIKKAGLFLQNKLHRGAHHV